MARTGRPSSALYPVLSAYCVDTMTAIAWSDGEFAGDRALVAAAEAAVMLGRSIPVYAGYSPTVATRDEPWGAAAALMAARPGRMLFVRGPVMPVEDADAGMQGMKLVGEVLH